MADAQVSDSLAAAAFWRLVKHLQHRVDVQNIDMMVQSGFCRNCLAKWLDEAAGDQAVTLEDGAAREAIYGMPYSEWKARFQEDSTPEQLRRMEESVIKNLK
jgi:hypothetical protein